MMHQLLSTIRQVVQAEVARLFAAREPAKRYGNIEVYDPKKHAARVIIQPEGVLSNWIPVSSEWIGNGYGVLAPLGKGDQVEIHWPEGGINEASITRRLYDQRNPPPQQAQNAQQGEYYIVDKAGSVLAMTQNGTMSIAGKVELDLSGATIKLTATTAVTVSAPTVTISNGGTTQSVKLADGSNSTVLKAQ